jgi:hypothetical protein
VAASSTVATGYGWEDADVALSGDAQGRKDWSSWRNDSGERSEDVMKEAGSKRAALKVSFAGDMPESSRGAAWRPNITQGRWEGHAGPARQAFSASLSRLWKRSTIPLL